MMAKASASHDDGRWIGKPVPRVEDRRFTTGRGRYTGDLEREGVLAVAFVRSPFPHASIRSIDLSEAREHPDAVAVYAAEDLPIEPLVGILDRPGFVPTELHALARDRVRYAGEPVAVVVARDRYAAEDIAELVTVDYDALDPVANVDQALAGRAVLHDAAPDNVLLDVLNDPQRDEGIDVAKELDRAHIVVEVSTDTSRLAALPMEGRACHAEWVDRDDELVIHTSTQVPHIVRHGLSLALGLPERQIRVIAPDVGGAFGQKCVVGKEEVVVAALGVRLKRPVLWVEDRNENLMSAPQAREQRYRARAGFDAEGRIGAVDVDLLVDAGAYHAYPFTCGVEPLMASVELPGIYKLGSLRIHARALATNKAPIAPYRGVSRPQVVMLMERVMERAAQQLGIDPVEIRRRNMISPGEFPYTGVTGLSYDEGSYLESLDILEQQLKDRGWYEARDKARSEGSIRRIGVGIACFSERTAYGTAAFAQRGMRVTPGFDLSTVRMDPSGTVTVSSGTASQGQGHETSLAQIAADALGLPLAAIRVRQGDTAVVHQGWGAIGSRSLVIGGGAVHRACVRLAEKLRFIAAHLLEVEPDQIMLAEGRAQVTGSARSLEIAEIARITHLQYYKLPATIEPGLEATGSFDPPGTFSNASHAAVVELDQVTGGVKILDYLVVEDCGVIVNPLIVDGQVIGGIAQGIGAALYEALQFDPDSGQPNTTSMMDYLAPTASEVPPISIEHLCTPSTHSETGSKGVGEGGAIGAPAAILNGVNDALGSQARPIEALPILPDHVLAALAAASLQE